jgi:hypothetical protein
VGHYLDAADAALRVMSSASDNETAEARLTYNSASQEMAALLLGLQAMMRPNKYRERAGLLSAGPSGTGSVRILLRLTLKHGGRE